MRKRKKKSIGDIVMDVVIWFVLILLTLICFYPMWYVLMASFADSTELVSNPGLLLWPERFGLGAYVLVFKNELLMGGFKNSLIVLGAGLPLNIVMTMLCGYFLASKGMMFKRPIALMIMFTMFFNGGLIPGYLNIRSLGLYNTLWSLILPTALSVYNAIICKTAIEGVPESLIESTYLDGANDFQVIFKIVLPLIKPTLAVLLLYYGVAHWNSWFQASIYIRESRLLPVQNILRSVLIDNGALGGKLPDGDSYNEYAEAIRYAAIVITSVPILCIYPFLQKHFTKGVMIGAVKG